MAYAISDGPPCMEAVHTWAAYTGESATINAAGAHDGGTRNRVVLEEAVGFYSLAEADDFRAPRVAQPGEFILPSERLGKTIVYRGRLEASTLPGLRTLAAAFRPAFRHRYREGRMTITPGTAWSTVVWFFDARVLSLEIDDRVDYNPGYPAPFQQDFALSLRMSDPRFYVSGTAPTASAATAVSATATNSGNDDTDPTFTITVPGGNPDIHLENTSVNTSNGTADLWLRAVPTGSLVVDFRSRVITLGGANAIGYFDSAATDWWDELIPGLKPGANTIKVTGGAWSATWRHAST